MDIWQSIALGIVEGVTEFLPVSSTGHLILAGGIFGVAKTDFTKSFEIIIQLGAIASVVFLYWRKLFNFEMLKKLAVAFLPTGIVGLLLYKTLKSYLIANEQVVLWALLLGGVVIILFEWRRKITPTFSEGKEELYDTRQNDSVGQVSYKHCLAIGFFQAVSIIPGVSRAAATILGGLWLGLKRSVIVEFSFLLAVPTILAASGFDLAKNYTAFSVDQFGVLAVGFAVSFIVALASIKFLLRYVERHSFISFGVYRIIIALVFWLAVF